MRWMTIAAALAVMPASPLAASKVWFVTIDGAAQYVVLTNPDPAESAIAGFLAEASTTATGHGAGG